MGDAFYDMEEAKTRFNEYDKNGSGDITLDEFIDGYLQDDDYYKQQIQSNQQFIKDSEKDKANFTAKLNEVKVLNEKILIPYRR